VTWRESFVRGASTGRLLAVRLAVFHQDELFADALSAVLASEECQVIAAESLTEAVRLAATTDAVLIDMRAEGALSAVRELSKRSPQLRVLGCIEGRDPRQVTAVMKAGVTAWISTADGFDRLVHLLRRPVGSIAGSMPLTRASGLPPVTTRDRYRLTTRETQVLDGLTRGASTSGLASALNVSPATARTHVHNVLAKLGVHTRLEAVAYAIEHQLVHVEDLADDEEGITRLEVDQV
jgi:two-component system nitrate/nitrite response regulator NarL